MHRGCQHFASTHESRRLKIRLKLRRTNPDDFFWFTMCQLNKYHYIDQQLDWTQAQQFCRKSYTDLATVRSMADIDQLKNAFKNRNGAWIGLHNSNTWRWSLPDLQFKKEDTKWGGGEPKDGNNCGAIWKTHAKWEAISCEKSTDFICYNDHVILINENRTWEEALYYCRHHHHDLVTITNLDEQRWVQEKTKNATTPYVWTGLRYTCTLGFWFWVSDEVVHYKNWASPEQVNKCDMSGAMETGGEHKWVKINDEEKFNFFCS
ncbi:L-selectin [Oryzias melastigma]|uniref:L-selectin n=1 Tax=Oryzias melastigma TaxID=30732 RepID=A0A834BUN3_ORYME|nr:L-selectin [Oryzias melastigma]